MLSCILKRQKTVQAANTVSTFCCSCNTMGWATKLEHFQNIV